MREWLSAAEIAALGLPGMPDTKRAVNRVATREGWDQRRNAVGEPLARDRGGRGGGTEYHYSLLPSYAQARLVALGTVARPEPREAVRADLARDEVWSQFEALSDKAKDKARARLGILQEVCTLERGGAAKNVAVAHVAAARKVSARSIYNWFEAVAGKPRLDWLPHLAPRHVGCVVSADCDAVAWEFLKADFLRLERPTLQSCYRRLQKAAREHGWTIPSVSTLERRLEREIPAPVLIAAREGQDALKRLYPDQERDKSALHALEAVNADGHEWDVWVRWPDGTVARPVMVAFQDIYSGMVLSWRVDRSEHKDAVRLALGDVIEQFGVPDHCVLDNGRAFASKWLTGGIPNRYRFKVRDEDPDGLLKLLDCEVHWAQPYSGQSKPIERAFRDFCDSIAKDPRFAGAWTGNTIANKPENYGSKAVELETFLEVLEEGIAEHNTREGRSSATCRGRSFAETFAASMAVAPIRKATEAQRRLWMLAAEGVRAASHDGSLKLFDNRYWSDALHAHMGKALVVRFDPADLHSGVHAYRLDGRYIGHVACIERTGFFDVDGARSHSRKRRAWMKAQNAKLAAERSMSIDQVAELMAKPDPLPDFQPSKVTRLVHGNTVRAVPMPEPQQDEPTTDFAKDFARGLRLIVAADEE